jgi:hypothetical protein
MEVKTAITITVTKLLEKKKSCFNQIKHQYWKLLFLLPSKVEADRLMNRFGIVETRLDKRRERGDIGARRDYEFSSLYNHTMRLASDGFLSYSQDPNLQKL